MSGWGFFSLGHIMGGFGMRVFSGGLLRVRERVRVMRGVIVGGWGRRGGGVEVVSCGGYARGAMVVMLWKGGVSFLKDLDDKVVLLTEGNWRKAVVERCWGAVDT